MLGQNYISIHTKLFRLVIQRCPFQRTVSVFFFKLKRLTSNSAKLPTTIKLCKILCQQKNETDNSEPTLSSISIKSWIISKSFTSILLRTIWDKFYPININHLILWIVHNIILIEKSKTHLSFGTMNKVHAQLNKNIS